MRLPRKDLWRSLLSNIQENQKVLDNVISAETWPAGQKGEERGNEKRLTDFQDSIGNIHADRTTQLQLYATIYKKK